MLSCNGIGHSKLTVGKKLNERIKAARVHFGLQYDLTVFDIFGGFEGVFSYKTDKSAILCPTKTEVADFVSFKGLIVQGMNFKHFDIPVTVEIQQNNHKASMC